ncbi:MAG: LPS assembly protein LptD [Holosporaceae bacterium]|nr:LPS assembly protein LptD [Holosporaceae bacterium]
MNFSKKHLLFLFFGYSSVFAGNITFINSDNTKYTKNKIVCNGNVVIVYYDHIISASEITYDSENEKVCANGDVIIKDKMQNVYFLDALSVNKNFTSGEGKNIKIITSHKSRLAAAKCFIRDKKYILENVIYTPCYKCTDDGRLTWQIKAINVTFDPNQYTEYEDVQFELFDTPVFYTPYLSHVSSGVNRKSGFLIPKFATSTENGFGFCPQYLWAISNSQELIFKPIITSKIGSTGQAYYGLRFPHGEFSADAGITGVKSANERVGAGAEEKQAVQKIRSSGYRGHVFSKLKYEINNVWRCDFDLNLVSDKYYLKKFPFFSNTDRVLQNSVKLEGFDDQNYTSAKAVMIQSENSEYIPRVFPVIERNYSSEFLYGTFNWDSCFINLDFNRHRSSREFISNASLEKEILLPYGYLFDFKGVLHFKALNVSEKERSDYNSSLNVTPQLNCALKWPLLSSSGFLSTVFTPTIGVILSKSQKKADIFEDQFCEITDLNFSDGNRSISSYNTDPGKRIYYGFKAAGYYRGENVYHFTVGRSVELTSVQNKLGATGLKYKHSNVVASLDVFLSSEWTLIGNCSYSSQTKRWTRTEIGLNFTDKKICFDVMVSRGKQCFYNPFVSASSNSEEQKNQRYSGAMFDVGWHLSPSSKLKGGMIIGNDNDTIVKSNNDNHRVIKQYAGIEYKNECATVDFLVERKNFRGGDLKPETIFRLVFTLKNLGM